MSHFSGTPSDDLPDVVAAGRTDVTTCVMSLSARSAEGRDADYIEWHLLDHEPEQHRLRSLRGSMRAVSTPECRAARVASTEAFDAVDHVMTYLFADFDMAVFGGLGAALAAGGRMPLRLPSVELGAYELEGRAAAPRIVAGADVVPWRPATGLFVLLEAGATDPHDLTAVTGVAGAWWYRGATGLTAADTSGRQLTLCYLDDDPVEVARRLTPVLEQRWDDGPEPLLAAPFHTVVPYAWDRHLP